MSHLSLRLLGEPAVTHAGQPVRFPTRKTLALLIYLAVESGMHAREMLTALFWPERDAQQARAALRSTLNYLRHALDDRSSSHLLITREALGFDLTAGDTLDVSTLTDVARSIPTGAVSTAALKEVLALYRGDFLAGFSLDDAPEWEQWAALRREQYHQHIHLVCERLAMQQRMAGDVTGVGETLQRWIALNPLHEPAYQQLIQLYLAAGDRAAAQRAYAACHAQLTAAFGAEPSPETRALIEAARLAPALPTTTGASPLASRQLDIPLVGREREYLQLVDWYARLRQTGALAVSVEGEAGVGKTRLVNEFLAWATAQGADVVRGQVFEASGRLPYQPLVDAWRARLECENAPDDLLADVWLTELSRLLPELRERYPDLPPPSGDDQAAQSRLFEALARLGLAFAARCPLILFVDDLQWADDASLDVLRYITRRWYESGAPVLLLITVRAEAMHPRARLAGWLAALERDGQLQRLPLPPLMLEATRALVQRLVGPAVMSDAINGRPADHVAHFAGWLHQESGGLPFFMSEFLKSLLERGLLTLRQWAGDQMVVTISPALLDQPRAQSLLPPGVRDVIRARLYQLDPDTFAVLVAGAVLGREFTFDQLCEIAAVREDVGLEALDDLLARRLIQPARAEGGAAGDQRYIFSHDKIRDVAYTEGGDARRQLYHRRALAMLERGDALAAELARHARAAGHAAAAFHYSMAAGDAAMGLFAVRTAVTHYEQARQHAPAPGHLKSANANDTGSDAHADVAALEHLYMQLGRAYELLGQMEQAQMIHQALLALARDSRQAALECVALNRLATLAAQRDFDLERSRSLLQEARQLAERNNDTRGLAETVWNLAQLGVYSSDSHATLLHGQQALALARELEQEDLIARSLNVLALGYAELGWWAQMERHAEEAVRIYAGLGNHALEADSRALLANALMMSGQMVAGIAQGRRALTITREIGSPWGQISAIIHLYTGLLDAGAYVEALALTREGVELARAHQIVPMLPYILTARGDVERALGLLDEASATHLEALAADETFPTQPFAEMIHSALCADYATMGNWEHAYAHARQALAHRRETYLCPSLTRWYETEALLRGGEHELARADAARFVAQVEAAENDGSNPRFQIPARRSLAILAQWAGNNAEAIAHLEAADALAVGLELPGERWWIAAQLATWYEAAREHEKASLARRRAVELVKHLAERIDDGALRARFQAVASVVMEIGS